MTPDTAPQDRFAVWFGKVVAVVSFVFLVVCATVGVTLLYDAAKSYQHDTTPLQAPDTVRKAVKP